MKNKEKKGVNFFAMAHTEFPENVAKQLINVRKTMISHPEFEKLNTKRQLEFCTTIVLIAVHTSNYDIWRINLDKKIPNFQFAIQRD